MPFSGLSDFIYLLEKKGELTRIKTFIDPVLEITEITDRVSKSNGKALLFENNATSFPVLINAFGSEKRMAIALNLENPEDAAHELSSLLHKISDLKGSFFSKLSSLPELIKLSGYMPSRVRGKGSCQQVVIRDPDLSLFPILKCWPYDGGRFITLPMVHTIHPETGHSNVGMYRMQIIDRNTTAMHWQLHKTGANHFAAWKKSGKRMPVAVALGGDPVYAYSATAPLPENIDEYILAGFLRKKKVRLVKCITSQLYIPSDADIVIEGYVDPAEEPFLEGPFGDHTGFYSLADWYPKFHVTCITHSRKAVYPATIVGVPPMEDAWLAKATEKIFLTPIKFALLPEVEDLHMPVAGVAHNLVIVKIEKSYQGQGKKVINSLLGAGQMMFTKYLVVVSGMVDIRNYHDLFRHVIENTDISSDLLFTSGPLDVLDHSSDKFCLGGKLGIDATIKLKEEKSATSAGDDSGMIVFPDLIAETLRKVLGRERRINILPELKTAIIGLNQSENKTSVRKTIEKLKDNLTDGNLRLILAVDHKVDLNDLNMVAWQVLGNSDPLRDIMNILGRAIFLDATVKAFSENRFSRKWPNVVTSDRKTIDDIDRKWDTLGLGPLIISPSLRTLDLKMEGDEEILVS
jgi:4-hydroxy-3-polyprenylbenzoate decarboxylase